MISVIQSAKEILSNAKIALNELPTWERNFTIFWLIGPFYLLIERSPADFWISIVAVTFLIRTTIKNDYNWTKPFWVKSSLIFWLISVLSGITSSLPVISTAEALAWYRFPLFAIACVFWLGKDKRVLYAMMLITFLALITMCVILSAELLIEGQKKGRLTWPYGDKVPGNFITKVGAPIFFLLVAWSLSQKTYLRNICVSLVLIVLFISAMTGERINTLILICGGILAAFSNNIEFRRLLVVIALLCLSASVIYITYTDQFKDYFVSFWDQLPTGNHSAYYRAMMPGIIAFTTDPFLGIGTGNLRHLCSEVVGLNENLDCHPHPHNFYIQLAGETGLIGLIAGTCFLWSIIIRCFFTSLKYRDNPLLSVIWIVPFAFFWPIASSSDFFGQWNNSFMWASLSLVLCVENMKKDISKKN